MRRTSTKAIIDLYDTTAQTDGSYVANSVKSFVDLSCLDSDRESVKYATCENNVFLLDGSFSYFPDSPDSDNFSYWSDSMGDGNGEFTVNPTLTREFMQLHSSIGITLAFDVNYPLPVKVKVSLYGYDEGYVLSNEGTYDIDTSTFFCDLPTVDYKKIVVEFIKVQPYQYARLAGIVYGRRLEYSSDSDKNVSKARILEEVDVTSAQFKVGTSSLTIIDPDELFSITNPSGAYSFLQKRQVIQIYEKVKTIINNVTTETEYKMAHHYIKEWSTENGTISKFESQDILGILGTTNYKGNLFSAAKVSVIVADIMDDFGFDNYTISDEIKDIVLSGAIAPCSNREALQQVMFACRGTIECTRDGAIRFYRIGNSTSTTINRDRIFMTPKYSITQEDLVTGIRVTAHDYVRESSLSEAYKETLGSGTYYVTFSDPFDDLEATNCTIVSYGYYHAIITVSSSAQVILEGHKYRDYTSIYEMNSDEVRAGTEANVKEVKSATLVSKTNAFGIASYLYNFYQYRLKHKLKIIYGAEKVGSFSVIENKNGLASAILESLDIDLTGGFIATIEATGYSLSINENDFMQETYIGSGEYILYSGDQLGVI